MTLGKTLTVVLVGAASALVSTANAEALRIGALPAADSIVLYVAQDKGFFKEAGLDVEIIPFKSALEIGAAMRAKKLDGHFGDLMNVFSQNEHGVPQAVILTTTHTSPEQRNFAFVTSPKAAADIKSLADLKKTDTAMSSATIIDYLLDRMSEEQKLPADALNRVEVKQIPIRLQMLLSGQTPTALLPEPLVSVVEAKGGRVIWDDRNLNETQAVVALRKEALTEANVKGIRAAVAKAAQVVEASPDEYRAVMVEKGLLPKSVAQNYKMLRFSFFKTADGLPPLPTEVEVKRVSEWMIAHKMLKNIPAYSEVIVK
ncbi:MAG: ABC transporter substrate-binding protein [Sutterella wadsworthensis]|nr:ABC transporter substrate-binding protein [Sutterella wadsworthensis]